jgi:hypothetical protein
MWDNLLWIFICIGVAGGIWSAIYHSMRPQSDVGDKPNRTEPTM